MFGGLKYNHYLCPKLIYIAHERYFFLRNLDIGLITFICVVNVYVNHTEEVSKLWIDTWIFAAWAYYTFRDPK